MFDYEKNIEYYNINAEKFAERTVSVDFEATQTRFLNKLSPGALILDFGQLSECQPHLIPRYISMCRCG